MCLDCEIRGMDEWVSACLFQFQILDCLALHFGCGYGNSSVKGYGQNSLGVQEGLGSV